MNKSEYTPKKDNIMKILVTGSQGFIGSYLCQELLKHGHHVVGIDNYSKYGPVVRPQDSHPNFDLVTYDVIDIHKIEFDNDFDIIIACAAMIGGITYFHKYAYDLLATNERIMASTFDYAIDLFKNHNLKRIIVISSSMVYENTNTYPTPEDEILRCPAPESTYGFQKLACEYFCKGASEQYGLPYTIIRPFNCVGVGENEAKNSELATVGNIKMMMSHVLPDLIHRALNSEKDAPVAILGSGDQIRNYTNGKDIAKAIRISMESEKAINEDFNISSPESLTVKELATKVHRHVHKCDPTSFLNLPGFIHDVQCRIPDVTKAQNVLSIICDTPIDESILEVIQWMKSAKQ